MKVASTSSPNHERCGIIKDTKRRDQDLLLFWSRYEIHECVDWCVAFSHRNHQRITQSEWGWMKIYTLQTGSTLVSSAVPDRSSHRWTYAYTGLFQWRKKRICVPVKAFLVENQGHRVLIDTGWSEACVDHPLSHLGFGLWFASEPVLKREEAIPYQLQKLSLKPSDIDAIVLTHLDCDHVSGLRPLKEAKHIYCSKEE